MQDPNDTALFQRGNILLKRLPHVVVGILRDTPVRFRHIDDALTTAWQNYCVQVQGPLTGYWPKYEMRVKEIIKSELAKCDHSDQQAIIRACRDALYVGGLEGPFDETFFAAGAALVEVIYALVYYAATVDEDAAVRKLVPMEPWMR